MAPTVHGLYVYPIKACKGISTEKASITSTGFAFDRQWMVVNDKGRMLSQRQEPTLALVEVSLPPEALQGGWGSVQQGDAMSISAPGMEVLQVPLVHPQQSGGILSKVLGAFTSSSNRPKVPASVWSWHGQAWDEGPEAAQWFSKYLGRACQLVQFDKEAEERLTDEAFAADYRTTFQDRYQFLITSQASLAALNERLDEPLPMNRFRPNIVMEGSAAFEEDDWEAIQVGKAGVTFYPAIPCGRCKVTTTNQVTAEVGAEPLLTLSIFRKGSLMGLAAPFRSDVMFGVLCVCKEAKSGTSATIHINDEVKVTSTRPLKGVVPKHP